MNDLAVNDKDRSDSVILGHPHTNTGSGQATHLDQVVELNVLQRPGKSTVRTMLMI
jgi:hypothetical protein